MSIASADFACCPRPAVEGSVSVGTEQAKEESLLCCQPMVAAETLISRLASLQSYHWTSYPHRDWLSIECGWVRVAFQPYHRQELVGGTQTLVVLASPQMCRSWFLCAQLKEGVPVG